MEIFAVLGITLITLMKYFGVDNQIILTTLAFFGIAIFRLLPSINKLMFSFQAVRFSKNTVEVIKEEISKNTYFYDNETSVTNKLEFEREIILKNVNYKYDKNFILKNLNLNIKKIVLLELKVKVVVAKVH